VASINSKDLASPFSKTRLGCETSLKIIESCLVLKKEIHLKVLVDRINNCPNTVVAHISAQMINEEGDVESHQGACKMTLR
jgi:hypothetical protein